MRPSFLKIYELVLQASFRADFSIEKLSAEMGSVMDQLWLNYEKAAAEADLPIEQLGGPRSSWAVGRREVAG